ncbi:MFS transporter [Aureimonas mangrovi]|uniref:MFS transporter n=1 Tax=Aureimonas mangrovi TaxID=2758041 RepID=UPI00163DB2CA|nr:MFS transporter [Aureimonas mangrovi]
MASTPSPTSPQPGPQIGFFTIFPSIMLPMFLAVVDQTIVATALPAIAGTLGSVERVSWIVIAYLVSTTIAAPVYGRLGDLVGRKRLMLVALTIFMLSSLACALAQSVEMLTAFRVLQGLGGGGLMTLSQALVGETIAPRERARYQGYLAAVAVSSSAFGPVAGGFLTQHFGWQSVFLVNIPVGLAAVVLTLRLPDRVPGAQPFRFDFAGLFLFATFVVSTLVMLEEIRAFEADLVATILFLFALAAVALALLVWREKRARSPLLPIPLLSNPSIWRADALAACHGATLVSLLTFLPIYLLVVHRVSPAETGLLLLPFTLGIGVGSLVTGRIVSITGRTAVFPSWGLVLATALLVFMAFTASDLGTGALAALLGAISIFMGTVMGVVQVTVQTAAGTSMLGAGAASVQFSRSLGAAVGTAVIGTLLFSSLTANAPEAARLFQAVMESGPGALDGLDQGARLSMQDALVDAFRTAFLGVACFAAIAAFLAWTIPMRRI